MHCIPLVIATFHVSCEGGWHMQRRFHDARCSQGQADVWAWERDWSMLWVWLRARDWQAGRGQAIITEFTTTVFDILLKGLFSRVETVTSLSKDVCSSWLLLDQGRWYSIHGTEALPGPQERWQWSTGRRVVSRRARWERGGGLTERVLSASRTSAQSL